MPLKSTLPFLFDASHTIELSDSVSWIITTMKCTKIVSFSLGGICIDFLIYVC